MRRRTLLATVGSGVAVGAAGCLSVFEDEPERYERIRLGLVAVSNRTEREQAVDVVLRRDGETVSWTRHEITGRSTNVVHGDRIGCLLDEPAGEYEVLVDSKRTGDSHDFSLAPHGWETMDLDIVIEESEGVSLLRTAGPADEEECRRLAALGELERGREES